jgi:cell cycle checkpoint protein
MQGMLWHWSMFKHYILTPLATAFLDKALFTSYTYNPSTSINDDIAEPPSFQVSLTALLETLQIFGASEASSRFSKPESNEYATSIRPHRITAFSNQTLGMTGICRFSYLGVGEPFCVILEEAGVTTTCNLNSYEPESADEIPFNKQELEVKIIMQAQFLYDAFLEIASMTATSAASSNRLKVVASPNAPFFSLSATGSLGSTTVEFGRSRDLLETFSVARRWTQYYKFEMVKAAVEAMKLASKVSFRGDNQGVLSLQFMIEVEGGGISFIDFRFVPFISGEEDDTEGDEEDYDDNRDEV